MLGVRALYVRVRACTCLVASDTFMVLPVYYRSVMATSTSETTEWCQFCGEYHTGPSSDALQDRIQNICNPEGDL